MKKHLVIFDIDGTLGDTNQLDHDCFKEAVCMVSGVSELPLNLWEGCPHITDTGVTQHLYQKLFGRFATEQEIRSIQDELVKRLYQACRNVSPDSFHIKGAIDMWNHLRKSPHIALAIATGCWSSNADTKLELLGIDASNIPLANADYLLSRRQITLDAIAKSILHYDCPRFDRITYVGDGLWDLHTSRDLGIDFIGIDCNHQAKLQAEGVESVFHDYSQLQAFLDCLK